MKRSPLKRSPMKRSRKKPVPAEIKRHWDRVAALGCVITHRRGATIHHVHGGSIREAFGAQAMPGVGQKQNDWLVIPLAAEYHTGQYGIDSGMGEFKSVEEWEAACGTQRDHLETVRIQILELHGYDIYQRAGINATTT